jgi:4-amino-4-deoxy-L-arabinose transferase-like glycosyltransferase
MIMYALVVVAFGLAIGGGLMFAARRSAQTDEQSVRRQRIVQYCFLALVLALLIFDAIDTPKHRYVNLAFATIAVGALVFDRLRGRRRR